MLIDLIRDRMDGAVYSAEDFYRGAEDYGHDDVCEAMDYGTEADVAQALCLYIDREMYNPELKNYVRCARWLRSDEQISLKVKEPFIMDVLTCLPGRKKQLPSQKIYKTGTVFHARQIYDDGYYRISVRKKGNGIIVSPEEIEQYFEIRRTQAIDFQ